MKPFVNGTVHNEATTPMDVEVHVFWRMKAPTGRLLTCGLHRTEYGLELQAAYVGDDPMWAEAVLSEEAGMVLAAAWKEIVLGKGGFVDIDLAH